MLPWLYKTLRPRLGWLTLVLLLAAVACLPMSLVESRWLIGASSLLGVALLAAWLGFAAGQTPLPSWLVGLFGLLTGIEWNVLFAGRLLPSGQALWHELVKAVHWLQQGLYGRWTADLPFVSLAGDVWLRLLALWERLAAWSQAGLQGTVSRDSLVLLLFAAIITWWLAYYAGWQLGRGRSALVAFAPLGTAILANVALTHGRGINYLRGFMGSAVLLLVVHRFEWRQQSWEKEGIDYSADLRSSVRLTGAGLTALLLLAALVVPYITWQQTVDAFWRFAYEPWTQVSRRLDRLFAARNPVPPAQSAGRGRESSEGHTLGAAPRLNDDLVFYIKTSDPPPPREDPYMMPYDYAYEPPKRYWRTVTYDSYTGQGWENGELEQARRPAGEPLSVPTYPHTVLTQIVTLRVAGNNLAPAANEPVRIDLASALVRRAEGDNVGFIVGEQTYTAISHIPAPTITQLREAPADYPPEIAARYLALPEVPRRVLDLAQELAAQAPTPYDKALAIEEHLRTYDYDLEIPDPPPDLDVADYLLFHTRRGYCDYYATAMVVMLRAVGVPSRYAGGYALGIYDHNRAAYRVSQRDAHAWVEVYFPGYGWVEFEPTPYRTTFRRPLGGETPTPPALPLEPYEATGSAEPYNLLLVLAVAVVGLGAVIWTAWSLLRAGKSFSSRKVAVQAYGGMVRWAERVRLGPARGDTPIEFAARLGQAVEARGEWAKGAAEEAELIGRTYVEARYAAQPLSARDAGQALTAWEKLRSKLRWMFIWRR